MALALDGIGDLKPPVVLPAFLITTDNVPDAPDTAGSTNPVLTVTGPGVTTPIVSTIDTIGDQDFYKVTLTAGTTYEFGMYNLTGGPNAVGVTDSYHGALRGRRNDPGGQRRRRRHHAP